jgi:hypothetical protein
LKDFAGVALKYSINARMRLHPVEWNIGEVAGTLAAIA